MKIKTIKIFFLILVFLLLLLSYSCGSSSSGWGIGPDPKVDPKTVSFDMSNSADWVKCYDASDVSNNTSTSPSYRYTWCSWSCGSGYKNANKSYVMIQFRNDGSGWYISFDSIQNGVCN